MNEAIRVENPIRRVAIGFAFAAGAIGMLGACGKPNNTGTIKRAETAATTTTSAPEAVEGVCDIMSTDECNTAIRTEIDKEFVKGSGFTAEEVKVGGEVDHTTNPTEAGSASFTDEDLKVLDSKEEIAAFYASDKERAKKARANLGEKLKESPADLERALKGEGYVPVQFNVPIDINGTTYFVGQELKKMTSERTVKNAGDVMWLYFDKDGKMVKEASLRADCSNPEFDKITPRRPGQPENPPIENPEKPTIPQKTAKPFTFVPEYDREPGSGGEPEYRMDPEADRNTDGYGPGDLEIADTDGDGIHNDIDACDNSPENINGYQDNDGCPDVAPTTTTAPASTPTTGPPREEAPSSPPTTAAPEKRDETPSEPNN